MALHDTLKNKRILILGGAGVSTDSGIPDYRGPQSSKTPRNPIRYQQFIQNPAFRQRYWARSVVGWPIMQRATPNPGHYALAQLESAGVVSGLLTQNVDGLHQQAGSKRVLELHGSLAVVRCLVCNKLESRRELQARMLALNPEFEAQALDVAPDGDAEVPEAMIAAFVVPACRECDGVLKPDVVFFGENVPKQRVFNAWRMLDDADVLMVVGSSLTVFSGYRFVVRAAKEQKPVVIINQGVTRGDELASLKLNAPLGETLPQLVALLDAA